MGRFIDRNKPKFTFNDSVFRNNEKKWHINKSYFNEVRSMDGTGVFLSAMGEILAFAPNDEHFPDGEYSYIELDMGDMVYSDGLKRQGSLLKTSIAVLLCRVICDGHFKKGKFDSKKVFVKK